MNDAAKSLAIVERNLTDDQLKEKAKLFIDSGFLPPAIKTISQAMTIILTGRDLGLGLMESLRSINVIQGKPCLSAQLMLALCQRTGELEDMKVKEEATACTVTIKRKGRSEYAYTFSDADAQGLGLLTKDNWQKQKKTMRRWRALSGNLRVTFADAICGLYTDDEAEDIIQAREELKVEKEQEVIEHHEDPAELDAGNIHNEQHTLELIDQIGASFIQDQAFYKAYPDKTIAEIFADKLPSGDPRGKKFLQRVIEKSRNEVDRVNIQKFLDAMEKEAAK